MPRATGRLATHRRESAKEFHAKSQRTAKAQGDSQRNLEDSPEWQNSGSLLGVHTGTRGARGLFPVLLCEPELVGLAHLERSFRFLCVRLHAAVAKGAKGP